MLGSVHFKGALSRIYYRLLKSQNLDLWGREPKKNGPFLLTIT